MMRCLKRGFTLIELIVVISVIAILMSFVLPASQRALLSARKQQARAHMQQIARAYSTYYNEVGSIPDATSSVELAEKFAAEGFLNNANLFIYPGDAQAPKVLRETIFPVRNGHAWESNKELSVVLVGNIVKNVNPATTPIAYTRGIEGNRWGENAPYGSRGGFIAFLDGNVRWYTDLAQDEGQLTTEESCSADLKHVIELSGGRALSPKTPH
ncbi:MAG: type II secretion system GspH family protein [Opitutales bacterium]|nr:type II secretion system GspH family protein [Opitutales bacterium]